MPWTFCSKQDVLDVYDVSEGSLKDYWSVIAEAFVRTHMGSRYLGNSTALTEYYDGNDSGVLVLRNPPISSVTSVYIDDELISSDTYLVTETAIWFLSGQIFPKGNMNVKVAYTSGGSSISTEVRIATTFMVVAVAQYFSSLATDTELIFTNAERLGDVPPNINIGLISHLNAIMRGLLKRYRINVR
jgi:hypothetical protein